MKTTIEVGGLYQRPESERRSIAKKKMLYDDSDSDNTIGDGLWCFRF
jgi:hypothetical protein